MDRMAQHLDNLLAAVTAQPEAPLSSLGFMSAEEQQLVLHTFNDTAGQAPSTCVHTFFERHVAATPQVSCLIDSATGSSLTYAEVNSAANRLARHLSSIGIATDMPVAVMMDKCFEAYIALIAILKAGGELCFPGCSSGLQTIYQLCCAIVMFEVSAGVLPATSVQQMPHHLVTTCVQAAISPSTTHCQQHVLLRCCSSPAHGCCSSALPWQTSSTACLLLRPLWPSQHGVSSQTSAPATFHYTAALTAPCTLCSHLVREMMQLPYSCCLFLKPTT